MTRFTITTIVAYIIILNSGVAEWRVSKEEKPIALSHKQKGKAVIKQHMIQHVTVQQRRWKNYEIIKSDDVESERKASEMKLI